jgi:hypothetical protein
LSKNFKGLGWVMVNGVGPDTPIRVGVAAALTFPDGSMTASGLRREAEHVISGASRRI